MFHNRQKGLHGKPQAADGGRRARARDRVRRAVPAPEANAENPTNLDVRKMTITYFPDMGLALNINCLSLEFSNFS